MTQTDLELLNLYARHGSEEAFAEIVSRHLNLVFSSAFRQVRQPQLAEEITQSTFVDLARQATRLAPNTILSAWLYQVTRRTAIDVIRRESRRQTREQVAHELNAMNAPETDWTHIEPLLEEGMGTLDEKERTALLLRYFERKSLSEVGAALGINEEAARKRVDRSVARLREFFDRRGVTVTASGLTATITTNAIIAAPPALGYTVTSAALVSGPTVAISTTAISKIIAMTTLEKILVSAAIVAVAAALYEVHESSKTQTRLLAAEQLGNSLSNQIDKLTRERDGFSAQLAFLNQAKTKFGSNELLRLRNEVGQLRRQLAATSRTPREDPAPIKQEEKGLTTEEYEKLESGAKLNYAQQWLAAFLTFVRQNQGQFPTNLAQAEPFLAEEAKIEHNLKDYEFPRSGMKFGLVPDSFEITFQGALQTVANPSQQIVLREKGEHFMSDGTYERAYGFADGHSESHRVGGISGSNSIGGSTFEADVKAFEVWEAEHGLVMAQPH